MSEGEKPKYRCYESGQGCGAGKTGLDLSGSLIATTEGGFSGYEVTQSKIPITTDTLINADMDGSNAGNASAPGDTIPLLHKEQLLREGCISI